MLNLSLLGIGIFVRSNVRRKNPLDELNIMIMLSSGKKTFGHLDKYLEMIVDNSSEIQGH